MLLEMEGGEAVLCAGTSRCPWLRGVGGEGSWCHARVSLCCRRQGGRMKIPGHRVLILL